MKHNNDFRYDLKIGNKGENLLAKILSYTGKEIEIKTDLQASKTGNVFVEYESRGKESGIKTTTASYWVFCIWTEAYKEQTYLFIPTRRLKKLIKTKDYKIASGGDNFTSKGFLVPKGDLLELI